MISIVQKPVSEKWFKELAKFFGNIYPCKMKSNWVDTTVETSSLSFSPHACHRVVCKWTARRTQMKHVRQFLELSLIYRILYIGNCLKNKNVTRKSFLFASSPRELAVIQLLDSTQIWKWPMLCRSLNPPQWYLVIDIVLSAFINTSCSTVSTTFDKVSY